MSEKLDGKNEKPFEKFRAFTKQIISVPKAEIDRREKQYQKAKKAKRSL